MTIKNEKVRKVISELDGLVTTGRTVSPGSSRRGPTLAVRLDLFNDRLSEIIDAVEALEAGFGEKLRERARLYRIEADNAEKRLSEPAATGQASLSRLHADDIDQMASEVTDAPGS